MSSGIWFSSMSTGLERWRSLSKTKTVSISTISPSFYINGLIFLITRCFYHSLKVSKQSKHIFLLLSDDEDKDLTVEEDDDILVEDDMEDDEDYVSIKSEAYDEMMADEPVPSNPTYTGPETTMEPTPSEMIRDIIKINRLVDKILE